MKKDSVLVKGLLGSSSLCGQDPDVSDDELDIYGEPRGEVMKSYGIISANVNEKPKEIQRRYYSFIELQS